MKRIYSARLSKLKHKENVKNNANWKNMENLYGKLTPVDDILELNSWKKAQKELNKDVTLVSKYTETVEVTEFTEDNKDKSNIQNWFKRLLGK